MSGFIGADPEGLRDLAKHLETSAERLDGVRRDLLNHFQRVRWVGDDAQRAKSEFRSVHARTMQHVTSMLGEVAKLIRGQAQEQSEASASGGLAGAAGIAQPLPAFHTLPDISKIAERPDETGGLPRSIHTARPHVYEAYTDPGAE